MLCKGSTLSIQNQVIRHLTHALNFKITAFHYSCMCQDRLNRLDTIDIRLLSRLKSNVQQVVVGLSWQEVIILENGTNSLVFTLACSWRKLSHRLF